MAVLKYWEALSIYISGDMIWSHDLSENDHHISCRNGLGGPQLGIIHVSQQRYTPVYNDVTQK